MSQHGTAPEGQVSIDDLNVAVDWLDLNEGGGEEGAACRRVAAFLRKEIASRCRNMAISALAKERGVTTAQVRSALRTQHKSQMAHQKQ